MKTISLRNISISFSGFLLCTLLATNLWAVQPISTGEVFPEIALPAPADPAQRQYLGLKDDQPFTLSQISGQLVLVEILNVHCPHCKKQTKPYNKLYRMIEADPETRGKIKMLGVAVANDDEAIDDFDVIYSVAYPLVPDRTFKLHSALHAGATPFSIYALRDSPTSPFIVTDTHLGSDNKMDELFEYLKDLLTMQSCEFTPAADLDRTEDEKLLPPQSETEVAKMTAEAFARQGKIVTGLRRLELPSGRWVYTATVLKDGTPQPLFAEVSNRSPICDVCHSVHFVYLFDKTGLVLDFVPLSLTKYGNLQWNDKEINFFSRRVVGKRLSADWTFNPQVDAVASATMTAAIIFDDLGQGQKLLEELKAQGLLD